MDIIIFNTEADLQEFKDNLGDGFSAEIAADSRYFNTMQGMYSVHGLKIDNLIKDSFSSGAVLHFMPMFIKEGWLKEKPQLASIMLNKLDDMHYVKIFTMELLEEKEFLQDNPKVLEVILDKCITDISDNGNHTNVELIISLLEGQEGLIEAGPGIAIKFLRACEYDRAHLPIVVSRIDEAQGLLESSRKLTFLTAVSSVKYPSVDSYTSRSVQMLDEGLDKAVLLKLLLEYYKNPQSQQLDKKLERLSEEVRFPALQVGYCRKKTRGSSPE